MALLSLKVTTSVTPTGGSTAAVTTVKSVNVTQSQTIGLTLQVAGPTGATGATGSVGATGATGAPGVGANWRGLWSSGTTYALGDGVTGSDGHNYISLVGSNLANNPVGDAGVHWADLITGLLTASDVVGRTKVLSPTDLGLIGVVSVMDAPWGAKGDTRVATDGVIGAGTLNQVSSTSLAFTNADVGKTVVVLSVGPNVLPGGVGGSVPGVFVSTVSSVATGVATLAGSATIPGTGLTVKVGTLDSAAIAAAVAAASARATAQGGSGVVKLVFPAGRHFLFNNVTAKSNVWLDFTGATLHNSSSNGAALATTMMFVPGTNASITNWHMRGGTWVGTSTEDGGSGSQGILYWNTAGFGQTGAASYTDISVMDATVTNWATGVWDIRGGARLRFSNNTCRNCSTFTGQNTINVIMGAGSGTVPSSDVFVQNNYFDGNGAECIAVGEANSPTSSFDRAVITGNICRNTGPASCIDIEWSTTTTGKARTLLIANNVTQNTATGGNSWGITASAGASGNTDPFTMSRVLITGNVVDGADGGILLDASEAIISSNHITAGSVNNPGILARGVQTIVSTADTNATTTVLNAPTNGAILNGCQLSGANIQNGTYLVSGAGTSTWVISQAATGTTVGGAITAYIMVKNVQVSGNFIHQPSTAAHNAIFATQLRDSKIHNNTITIDPGASGVASQALDSILLQRAGWTDVTDNRIDYALAYAVQVDSCNDCNVLRNRIYNPSELGVNVASGITAGSLTGLPFRIKDNIIVDDRGTHKMQFGVTLGSNANVLAQVLDNDIRGSTGAAVNGFTLISLLRGNVSDQNAYPAVTSSPTVTASPFTFTNTDPYYETVYVDGGTISTIQHTRPGSSARFITAGSNVGVQLAPGDAIIVTYTVAPTMVKIPWG